MDETRALLDQLMGRERDIPVDKRTNRARRVSDDDICKPYLCGLCPYVDFRNTRSDLGEHPPNQDHDADVKTQWDKLSQDEKDRYGYERELMSYLEELVVNCDRRVEKNKERLKLEQGDDKVKDSQITRLIDMERVMSEKMELSERQAEEGLVDEAQALLAEVARMREHKSALEKQLAEKNENGKRDIVCEVSGNIMLVSGNILHTAENEERIRCHFQGKQYLGWKAVRDKLKALKEMFADRPIRDRGRDIGERDRERGRSKDRAGDRSGDRTRDLGRSRDRSRERDRGRDRERRDSRERDRGRDRSRDRERSRDRDRGSRYGNGGDRYRRRSRSRDRDRDRGSYSYYGR